MLRGGRFWAIDHLRSNIELRSSKNKIIRSVLKNWHSVLEVRNVQYRLSSFFSLSQMTIIRRAYGSSKAFHLRRLHLDLSVKSNDRALPTKKAFNHQKRVSPKQTSHCSSRLRTEIGNAWYRKLWSLEIAIRLVRGLYRGYLSQEMTASKNLTRRIY